MHKLPEADAPSAAPIDFGQFLTVDIRVGTVVEAEVHAEARNPGLKLRIDFGPPIGVKKSCAQIAALYAPEELIGRQVAAVVNFPSRQIGKAVSEVLTLGFPDAEGRVVLIAPDKLVANGARLF